MAVEPAAQGCGIGYQLATALIKKATERGFTSVILEGNTRVKASIALFRKLGFKETILNTSTSANGLLTRSNIFMKLDLIPTPLLEYYI
jgi:L-amino acid N-acyltransferase YncA